MAHGRILPALSSPQVVRTLPTSDLEQLAAEMRARLTEVVDQRGGHLASNLGVVELSIALHRTYDFLRDRLVWDTSHQSYCHKLLTGRNELFERLRQYEGCCGFASKDESPYDLFDAGHAGTSVSAGLGIAVGDRALRRLADDRLGAEGREAEVSGSGRRQSRTVVVIGDAAMAAGMPLEAMNHVGDLKQDLLVILNDNRMSIDVSVGALSKYLNRIRSGSFYRGLKRDIHGWIPRIPLVGKSIEEGLEQLHDIVHNAFVPGQIFEEFGFRYFGPMDGHDLGQLIEILGQLKTMQGPVLLHVLTDKGHGYAPAQEDPVKYHASKGFLPKSRSVAEAPRPPARRTYTDVFRDTMLRLAEEDPLVHAVTAAMPGGTGLASFQKRFPKRYFDVGIAEQHGTCFSSGLAFAGLKPVFAVYSTFLQRGFDQVVHDVCLQGNSVVFALDRAGVVEDGPTHHGVFDIAFLRPIPGIGLMAPADGEELEEMLSLAIDRDHACAIRYPKGEVPMLTRSQPRPPVEWGKGEIIRLPRRITLLAYGSMVEIALGAARELEAQGLPIGVVNLRFAKPIDRELLKSLEDPHRILITLEEHVASGGVGSAILEEIHAERLEFERVCVWGIPDSFIPFGARARLLEKMRLDVGGVTERLRAEAADSSGLDPSRAPSESSASQPEGDSAFLGPRACGRD